MSEQPNEFPSEVVNTLRSKHLNEGVRPIMACIGTPEQFEDYPGAEEKIFKDDILLPGGIKNIDYYANPQDLEAQQFKNAGWNSYAISSIDNSDKFSKSFLNCTGVVIAGIDKETGENISFMSHQDPFYFLSGEKSKEAFINDLGIRIQELKARSIGGTVDAVIVGGNYKADRGGGHSKSIKLSIEESESIRENYLNSIKLLTQEITSILGFEPVVITGPKLQSGRDNIFYENKNRRLYIMRKEIGIGATESYAPSNVAEQEKKWQTNN